MIHETFLNVFTAALLLSLSFVLRSGPSSDTPWTEEDRR